MTDTLLTGRVAVVTGASSPIGAAIVRDLLDEGAAVVCSGRDEEALREVARHERASWRAGDLTDEAVLDALATQAENRHGPVDLLVAAAGGGGRPQPLAELDPATWRGTIERNLTTTYLTLRRFVPAMADRGRGSVVTVASDAAHGVRGASLAYSAAKAAVLALTRDVATEVAASGVRVNAVAPGAVRTPALERAGEDVVDRVAATHPQHRIGTVEDVAAAVVHLLSERSAWVTGHCLDLGGRTLR